MSYTQIYVHPTLKFGGIEKTDAKYVVLGIPFDFTSTYRPGSRFGPSAIREASQNLETYCLRSGIDVEDIGVQDIGDLDILESVEGTLKRIQLVTKEILGYKKIPIFLGGEHTITYGCAQAFHDAAIISFDAHMDLRNEYLGSRLSHATFMRRLFEKTKTKIVEIGPRAVCREELDFAEKNDLRYISSLDIMRQGIKDVIKEIKKVSSNSNKIYITIDMDVIDPAYAPGIGNPVPEGLTPTILIDILSELCDKRLVGIDVVEVCPQYDNGETAILASHIVFNIMSFIAKTF